MRQDKQEQQKQQQPYRRVEPKQISVDGPGLPRKELLVFDGVVQSGDYSRSRRRGER